MPGGSACTPLPVNQHSAGQTPDDSRRPVRPAPKKAVGTGSLSASHPFTQLHGKPFLRCDTDERRASDSYKLCISGKHCHHTMVKIPCQSKYKKSARAGTFRPCRNHAPSLLRTNFLRILPSRFGAFTHTMRTAIYVTSPAFPHGSNSIPIQSALLRPGPPTPNPVCTGKSVVIPSRSAQCRSPSTTRRASCSIACPIVSPAYASPASPHLMPMTP